MTTCTIPGRTHQAEAGLLLCRTHLDQLAEDLVGVEDEYGQLVDDGEGWPAAAPSLAIVWGGTKGSTLAREQAPVRLDAVVLGDERYVRDDEVRNPAGFDRQGILSAYGVLHHYAEIVRELRMLEPPSEASVAVERKLLTRHLDWVAAQPWTAELAQTVHDLHGQLQRANGTAEPGPIPGRCPRPVDDQATECGGRLYPVKPKHTSGPLVHIGSEDVVQAIECDKNATHRWEDKALIRLALILDQQAERSA